MVYWGPITTNQNHGKTNCYNCMYLPGTQGICSQFVTLLSSCRQRYGTYDSAPKPVCFITGSIY